MCQFHAYYVINVDENQIQGKFHPRISCAVDKYVLQGIKEALDIVMKTSEFVK